MPFLTEEQREKIEKICRSHGIKILLLFGSQVTGKIHGESDIDFAFAARPNLDFEKEARFNAELQALFGSIRVDTVNIFKTSPLLKKRIFDEHQILYMADNFLYHSLQSYAIKSYLETKHLRDNLKDYLNKKYVSNR